MVSNNKTKLRGMNDGETGTLTGIDCLGDQATAPPEAHSRGKLRIVLEGLPGELGKRQLIGDTVREAGSDGVKELRTENDPLEMVVAGLPLRNRTLRRTLQGLESESIDI